MGIADCRLQARSGGISLHTEGGQTTLKPKAVHAPPLQSSSTTHLPQPGPDKKTAWKTKVLVCVRGNCQLVQWAGAVLGQGISRVLEPRPYVPLSQFGPSHSPFHLLLVIHSTAVYRRATRDIKDWTGLPKRCAISALFHPGPHTAVSHTDHESTTGLVPSSKAGQTFLPPLLTTGGKASEPRRKEKGSRAVGGVADRSKFGLPRR
ncbi:uncharacterized protein BDZ83DRAFT_246807 [Colletotrichum acutatum]|uniref:Uncharacterized protein n=1 Tax=Glomerella acutata TaxID=27357 RepID=A0AAD9D3C3_GLOAC|nr:uncharacterized protein BDZ83DRAFT_246807 [Colletotrichum acutatum]KAK1731351.1 hypothetical protein BDZ83DRAFT_246807 [Colletotrichum acutatum]